MNSTSLELAEQIYLKWHSNEVSNQADLAQEAGLRCSVTNHIVRGLHRYAYLKDKFPGLQRTRLSEKRRGRSARLVEPVVATEATGVAEPELDLGAEAIEIFPSLKPQVAVVLAQHCFAELSELLHIISKPCPRLQRYLGHSRRPVKNEKDENAVKQDVKEEIAEGERLSREFLEEKV